MRTTGGSAAVINLTSGQALKSVGDYCEAHPAGTIADAAAAWQASLPQQAARPPERSSGSLILNLDRAPERKPLLDRR
ncbi:MAG: hypothetical protein WEA28_12475 [Xanthobacteraceae bacterium]